ncbi:PepSY-associated TM helix domain-containing protein [Rubrivirga sp. S365]|uniref:PepSY-associated TM helix domain-containing protein n=1 Tax=Rubrivirga litoralis TaxID=3075598 RepID=A0ABU3BU26_9BACT|nr:MULTISPECIES: PepSY-associated TM helix domain-containing protein [unclassified Rubrivirga]MDT0632782.1 PepSY-associated TM helix domain-containing protein [Rubrivirga sp. F394]MDT7855178.1 PepSY-associated TM helix domain-containing protein [Rubrivirga sp. S365]
METISRPTRPPTPPAPPPGGAAPSAKKKKLVGPRAFKLLWDAHSVTGVVLGLGLFVIFYCGAFALYRAEIQAWADPALRATEQTAGAMLSADAAVGEILRERPPAQGADVLLVYPFAERAYYWLRYPTAAGDTLDHWVSATSGAVLPTRSRSGVAEVLYDLHYFAQAGLVGRILSGLAAVFLLFGVASGVLIHLRKLPRDWHTFRPRGKLRDALADAHTVLGLVGLPYTVMYAVTGAFFSLLIVILGPTLLVVFDGDEGALEAVLTGVEEPPLELTGEAAEMWSPDALLAALPPLWDDAEITVLHVHGWGDAGGLAAFESGVRESVTASGKAVLNPATGEVLAVSDPRRPTALGATTTAMTTLHFATFGGWLMTALFFVLALAAGAVILTGNVLWVLVRRPKDPRATPRLHRVLARLTVGVGVGLVAAVPVLFLASRVLPIDLDGRVAWENAAFFGVWLALVAAAFAGRSPVSAARWQLGLAAVLSAAVPVASGLLGGPWPWESAANGWWGVFWVDIGFALAAPLLVWTARRLSPGAPQHTPPRPEVVRSPRPA